MSFVRGGRREGWLRDRLLTPKVRMRSPPRIKFTVEKGTQEIFTAQLKSPLKFTEEGAEAFAKEAMKTIVEHIEDFSTSKSRGGLRDSVGWDKEDLGELGWLGVGGIGVGEADVPRNPKGDNYAGYVDRGTDPSIGRFVPKVADVELFDIRDPTRSYKWHGVPESWIPKATEGVSELEEAWWGSRYKKAMMKERTKWRFGKLYQSRKEGLLLLPFGKSPKGRRVLQAHYPSYEVTTMGGVKMPLPSGTGMDFMVGGLTRTRPSNWQRHEDLKEFSQRYKEEKARLGDAFNKEKLLQEYADRGMGEDYNDYLFALGGIERGYGGKGNILRSAGDVGYAAFTIDVRMATHELGRGLLAFRPLEGMNVGMKTSNERGLGLRIPTGEHPGTPARNYIRNSAAHMKIWLKNLISAGGILTGGGKGMRGRGLRRMT